MVRLSRITTKTGDDGLTSLGDGSRVSKTDPRITAIGSVDELNAAIGVAEAAASGSKQTESQQLARILRQVQNDLFDAGAELCLPSSGDSESSEADRLKITDTYVNRIECQTDDVNAQLSQLDSFVLPGGSELSARLHLARAMCRRVERDVLLLAESSDVGPALRRYLNRLSDLLFVLARLANDSGQSDVLWQPGVTSTPYQPEKPPG